MSAAPAIPERPRFATFGSPIKNLLLRRDALRFFSQIADHSDIVSLRIGPRRVVVLNHPELIREMLITQQGKFIKSMVLQRARRVLGNGLLTSEGEFHLRQRRMMQPAFHRQRIVSYGETMTSFAVRIRDSWHAGQPVDMHEQMMRLTLQIAGKTLFDADVAGDAQEVGEAIQIFMDSFGLMFIPFSGLLEKWPIPPFNRVTHARRRLDAVIYRLINERRASGRDHGDLLSMLLRAQDSEGDGARMTDDQLRDECVTILLAGHETTANALSFTWMLLAQHPEAEAKLHAELDHLGGRVPTLEDLPRLKYIEHVFAESMRLYPPAYALGREALTDLEIGGVKIEKGCIVLCSQWTMHRDRRYFAEADKFLPGRWEAENKLPKFAYFPFGGGSRQCIGEAFAWMEGVLVLATIAQRWKFRLEPGFKLELQPAITLRPKRGIPMRVLAREQA